MFPDKQIIIFIKCRLHVTFKVHLPVGNAVVIDILVSVGLFIPQGSLLLREPGMLEFPPTHRFTRQMIEGILLGGCGFC